MSKKKLWRVTWTLEMSHDVQAETRAEAIEIAEDMGEVNASFRRGKSKARVITQQPTTKGTEQ